MSDLILDLLRRERVPKCLLRKRNKKLNYLLGRGRRKIQPGRQQVNKENFASTASRSSSNTEERDLLEVVEAYSSDQEDMDQNRPPPRAKNIMAKFAMGKSVPQVSKKTAAPAVPPAPKKVSGSSVPTSPRPDINSKEERRSKKDHERPDSQLAEKGKSPDIPPPQKKQKTKTSQIGRAHV